MTNLADRGREAMMASTAEWAESQGVAAGCDAPPVLDYDEPCLRSAREIAARAIVLHGVASIGYGIDPRPIVEWLRVNGLWNEVSPSEQRFFAKVDPSEVELSDARWRAEAEWTLLWAIGRVESLGLPTSYCDTERLVDEIMPALGDDLGPFLDESQLRPPSVWLAEDDRHYDLWCYRAKARREKLPLPEDLMEEVLFQRRYAFEWMSGDEAWDDVTCDA